MTKARDGPTTAAFLDRRIDDVMKFEKFKAEWRGSADQRLEPDPLPGPAALPAALARGY